MNKQIEKLESSLRSSLNRGILVGVFVSYFQVFAFGFGSLVIILQLTYPIENLPMLGTGGMLITFLLSFFVGRRLFFSAEDSLALLDKRANAGGLFLALNEYAQEGWTGSESKFLEKIPSNPSLDFKRIFPRFLIPLLFLVGVFFIPPREPERTISESVSIAKITEAGEKIKLAKIMDVVPDEEIDKLEEELEAFTGELKEKTTETKRNRDT